MLPWLSLATRLPPVNRRNTDCQWSWMNSVVCSTCVKQLSVLSLGPTLISSDLSQQHVQVIDMNEWITCWSIILQFAVIQTKCCWNVSKFYMQMCLSGDGGGNELHTISKQQSFLFWKEKLHLCPRGVKVIGLEAADRKSLTSCHMTDMWPLTPSWSPNKIITEVFEDWKTGAAAVM